MWLVRAVFASIFVSAVLAATSAHADYQRSQRWFNALSEWERKGIQTNLILGGYYIGLADGKFGRNTYNAVINFEREHSFLPNGHLNQFEAALLVKAKKEWTSNFQLNDARDDRAGIMLPMPYALVSRRQDTERGSIWTSSNVPFEVQTSAYLSAETPLPVLYDVVGSERVSPGADYRFLGSDFFVISGTYDGSRFYRYFRQNGQHITGFAVQWSTVIDAKAARMPVYFVSKATYFAPRYAVPRLVPEEHDGAQHERPPWRDTEPERPNAQKPEMGSGSGFFVSATGLILTNHHVVDGCSSVEVSGYGKAEVLRTSGDLDLAAVLVARPSADQMTAVIETVAAVPGSKVVAGGFPLPDVLGNNFALSYGQVTMDTGGRDFAMNAVLQPGNSGGPVINARGRVVGVAVAKLNEDKMMRENGTTGGNFSFAIDASHARDFLRPFAIEARPALPTEGAPPSDEDLAASLKRYSVQILCRR